MNENLSRIVSDLVKSKGGEELSFRAHRLRDEIKKVIESEETIFGKIRGLVESFREIIPDEKQRYHAALKALSTTSKLSRQEIVKAVDNQLEEIKILEKGLLSSIPGWRDELKVMQAASQEMKEEIAALREKKARLEKEEKEILNSMAAREKEIALVEKALGELFTEIGAEIAEVRKKVEESAAVPEIAVAQAVPAAAGGAELTSEAPAPAAAATQNTEFQKKCPMCGGQMNFHGKEQMWMCYVCAYEEQGTGEQKIPTPEPAAPQVAEGQKKCPMCGGHMNFQLDGDKWMCYTCAYEESQEGHTPGTSEAKREKASAPEATWLAELNADLGEPQKRSVPSSEQPTKKKTCPSCRKKMNWYAEEKAWRCPFCEYERRI